MTKKQRIVSAIIGGAVAVGAGTGAVVWAHPDISLYSIQTRLADTSLDVPVDVAAATIDIAQAQEIAMQEVGSGDVNRIIFRGEGSRDEQSESLLYVVRISNPTTFQDVTHVAIDATSGEIINTIFGELNVNNAPATFEASTIPVTPLQAQETALAQVPGGDVVQIMLRGTPSGDVSYVVQILQGDQRVNVTVNSTTGEVSEIADR